MADDDKNFEEVPPQAKRTGRENPDARNQPGEFADDMSTNRFGETPGPGEEEGD